MTLLISYLSYRVRRLRPLLDGEPIVMVQNGKVLDRNLKRERLTEEELAMEARLQQIDSLDKVDWAVLEKGGQMSFITKKHLSPGRNRVEVRPVPAGQPRPLSGRTNWIGHAVRRPLASRPFAKG